MKKYKKIKSQTILFALFALIIAISACSEDKTPMAKAIKNRNLLPIMATYNVTTLISDSGVTQYRIKAKEWLVYDKVRNPYWAFYKGLFLEKFDTAHHVIATIKCDTATYFSVKKVWELKGHVKIKNVKGDRFSTSQLFWDQNAEKIYSKKFITIVQKGKFITGHGFESNQDMTVYTIFKTAGHISFDEKKLAQPSNKPLTPHK